jgi:hypothetical protein
LAATANYWHLHAVGTGPVAFSGGGTLLLDDAVHFGGLVAGFNVPADLLDIAYISGTTTSSWTQPTSGANASGTLQIREAASVGGLFHSPLPKAYVRKNANQTPPRIKTARLVLITNSRRIDGPGSACRASVAVSTI